MYAPHTKYKSTSEQTFDMKLLTDKIQVTKWWKTIFCQSVTPDTHGHVSLMILNGTLSRDTTNLFWNQDKK